MTIEEAEKCVQELNEIAERRYAEACDKLHAEQSAQLNKDFAILLTCVAKDAFFDGQRGAIDNAAMKAYDMGYPHVRDAINNLLKSHP